MEFRSSLISSSKRHSLSSANSSSSICCSSSCHSWLSFSNMIKSPSQKFPFSFASVARIISWFTKSCKWEYQDGATSKDKILLIWVNTSCSAIWWQEECTLMKTWSFPSTKSLLSCWLCAKHSSKFSSSWRSSPTTVSWFKWLDNLSSILEVSWVSSWCGSFSSPFSTRYLVQSLDLAIIQVSTTSCS